MENIWRGWLREEIKRGKLKAKTLIKITYEKCIEKNRPNWNNKYQTFKTSYHWIDTFKVYNPYNESKLSNFALSKTATGLINWNLINTYNEDRALVSFV